MEGLFEGTKVLSKVNKSYQIKGPTLPGHAQHVMSIHSLFNTCTNLLASQEGHHGVVLSKVNNELKVAKQHPVI